MRTRGAVLRSAPGTFDVIDLELEDPRPDEVRVQLRASGLCHSDDHFVTGDLTLGHYPMACGHEGAGVVTDVGPNTKGLAEGDHVVFSFIPSCGHCRWCAIGRQNLCDHGATLLQGPRWTDGTFRMRTLDGEDVGQASGLGTFCADTVVSLESVVKIDDDVPFDVACLLGCGVGTGWGSAVNLGEVSPGDTVIVMGIGGIGINAVQGARHAGAGRIIAVDPVAFKQEKAQEVGATHSCASMEEATDLARSMTNGQGADAAIVTVGVVTGDHVAQAFAATRKAGITVVTGLGDEKAKGLPISLKELTLYQKRLQGSLFGGCNPNWDIRRQIELYRDGALMLEELITTRYAHDQINEGYDDLRAGRNIRGIIEYA